MLTGVFGIIAVAGLIAAFPALRRKFRPAQYATVGVAPAGGAAEFAVPVPARARRRLLTVAVGQEGGRLRVHRLRLGPVSYATVERTTIMGG